MVPVKYMLLIYSNPESWAGLSAEQREALGRSHEELSRELTEQGLLVSSAGLADPRMKIEIEVTALRKRSGAAAKAKAAPRKKTKAPRRKK